MPTERLLDAGISIAMGTDVAGGRSFRIPHSLSKAYDNALATGTTLSNAHLLWLGTRGGAMALKEDRLGAISPNFKADFICIDRPNWVETPEQILAQLLFYAEAGSVRETWIGGQKVWPTFNP